jgi:ethanolamine ammonia-lyase large subunit
MIDCRAEKKIEAKKIVVDSDKEVTVIPQDAKNVNMNVGDVSNWTETKVRDFLLKQNLSPMIPLCDGINGEELMNLYTMCKTNSALMYRSLKFELLHGHHRILPIATYLHFVSRIRLACSNGLCTSSPTANKHPDVYLQDCE